MKKIILTIAACVAAISMNAQNSCATAQTITDTPDDSTATSYTVTDIDGDALTVDCHGITDQQGNILLPTAAEWFSYTVGGVDEIVTISTNLAANTGGDTKLTVYSGTCASLICYAANDDVDAQGGIYLSELSFLAQAGQTYIVTFDNFWSEDQDTGGTVPDGFDFEISTTTTIPPAPGVATNPTPADDAVNVVIDESDGNSDGDPDMAVALSWTAPTGTVTGYELYFAATTAPASISDMRFLGVLTANTSINIINSQYNTEYFWALRPINGARYNGPDDSQLVIWSYTTEQDAAVEDNQLVDISLYPNPVVNELHIDMPASVELKSATMYDLLGKAKEVMINEDNVMNLSQMASGVYVLKLETSQGTLTKKVIKQ